MADAPAGAVHSAAAAHDAWLTSRDPSATLKAAAALWAVSILGRLLSVWRLLALCSMAAFTVPVALDANRHRLDKAWRDASRAVQVGWADGSGVRATLPGDARRWNPS